MGVVFSMAAKDLRLLLRDRMGLFFTLVFPLIYAIFFGTIFSGMGDDDGGAAEVRVLLVDEDGTPESRAFFEALDGSASIRLTPAPSREAAAEAVRSGREPAFLVAGPGFGAAVSAMFSGTPAQLELGVDPSRRAERMMLEGVILQSAFQQMGERFTDPAAMRRAMDRARESLGGGDMPASMRASLESLFASVEGVSDSMAATEGEDGEPDAAAAEGVMAAMTPVKIVEAEVIRARRSGPDNAFEISFPQAISWAVIAATAAFGISFVTERQKGTLVRLTAAPLSVGTVLLGKAAACFATVVGVTGLLLAVGALAFGARPDSYALLAMVVACIGVCFVGLMMLLATLAKTEAAAAGIGWAVMMVFAMLGGGMVPALFMPRWMQSIGSVSPVRWAILGLEGALWRGFGLSQMLLPMGVLLGVGLAGFLGARALLARSMTR